MSSNYVNGKFELRHGGKDYCYAVTPDNLLTMFFNRKKRQAVIRRVNMVGMLMYDENQYDLVLDETSNSFSYNLEPFEDLWNEFWSYWNKKDKSDLYPQAENRVSNSKKALFGAYEDNQTFCLITSDNPMGKQYSAEENNKRREKFENDLKSIHRLYTKLKGAYGNEEKTFLIINITLTECMWLAQAYQQESFVFGKKENGKMIYHYYKTSGGKKYIDREQVYNVVNQKDAEGFFSRINDFKFKINFKLEFLDSLQRVFYDRYSWNPKFEENFERYMKENMTIKHYYFENWFLMETKDHFMKRLERLTSSGSENLDESEVALYMELSQKETSDAKVHYFRHGIEFICRESQCKKQGIEDYSKLED